MEDEMVGWHHQFNGHEFEQAPGDGEGQGSLVCCSSRGCKELHTTEQLSTRAARVSYSVWYILILEQIHGLSEGTQLGVLCFIWPSWSGKASVRC